MKEFTEINTINGKTYLALSQREEESNIGNKFDDFEIQGSLGRGQFGKIFKVISKLNQKTYAMKRVDLESLNNPYKQKEYQLALNESKYLTVLNHPNIVKYYKNFTEGDYLYIIMEKAGNGDLSDFIEAHKESGRQINEEKILNIFLQCMKALAYIHKFGVIHRDIKPANILMDNNMNILIGDFGVSTVKKNNNDNNNNPAYLNAGYLYILDDEKMQCNNTLVYTDGYGAKEMMERNDYDQKIDVYSMGVSFHEMCFFEKPCGKKNYNVNYSKEIINIIYEMLEEDKNKRKSSEYFLKKISEIYSRKYNRNTSIDAIVRCLYAFDDIKDYYKELNANENKDKPVTNAFTLCVQKMTAEDMNFFINSIHDLREILCTENNKFDKTKEINPKLVFEFLIRKLHEEKNYNIFFNNIENKYFIKSGEELAKTSKVEILINFENKIFSKLNSLICQKFMGLFKTAFICGICSMKTYSFSGYFFVTINMETIIKDMVPNIENYFYFQNVSYIIEEKYCPKCLRLTQHKKHKQFYTVPDCLVVVLNRGRNDYCRVPFKLKQYIDLKELVETGGKNYKVIGYINKDYERDRYISYFEFKALNQWYKCDFNNVSNYFYNHNNDLNKDEKGELIIAFYEYCNN